MKDKGQLLSILLRQIEKQDIRLDSSVLVVGGGDDDVAILQGVGLKNYVISNVSDSSVLLDAEALALPDNSYDIVFAHAVLHHCRSPHKAVSEMIRVARHHVLFVEPNDSAFMRMLVALHFSSEYEITAVMDNEFVRGGLRNTCVPNYIYRWTLRELEKTAAATGAEREMTCFGGGYWDFYVNERDLDLRKDTRIGMITGIIGTSRFLRLLHLSQSILNRIPGLQSQGNKFLGGVTKGQALKPWLKEENGQVVFDRQWGQR